MSFLKRRFVFVGFFLGALASHAQGAASLIQTSQVQCRVLPFGLARLTANLQGDELISSKQLTNDQCTLLLSILRRFSDINGNIPVDVVQANRVVERAVSFAAPDLTSPATACEEATEQLTSLTLPIDEVLVHFANASHHAIDCPRGLKFDFQPNNVYLVIQADGSRIAP